MAKLTLANTEIKLCTKPENMEKYKIRINLCPTWHLKCLVPAISKLKTKECFFFCFLAFWLCLCILGDGGKD